jgi:DNA recombination-dependent growth factor C
MWNEMGLLSPTVSITRYRVEGQLPSPVNEHVTEALKKNTIHEIDNDAGEQAIGWTSFDAPYQPDFEGSRFVIDTLWVFSLRIDKKSIPTKVLKKHYNMEVTQRLVESGRDYLSKTEKKQLKDHVITVLNTRIPATPNVYDIVWNYEEGWLWFFSNLKSANEELETLFTRSFKLSLIRMFPYTAGLNAGLSGPDKDCLDQLKPTLFME